MTSQIDYTKPTAVVAFTADVRNNFLTAYNEITALQNAVAPIPSQMAGLLNAISAMGGGLPHGPVGAIQFFDPVTNTFGGNTDFTFDSTSKSMNINLANDAWNSVSGTYTVEPTNLSLVSGNPVVAEWEITSTDNITGTTVANVTNYCAVWSKKTILAGHQQSLPADPNKRTHHFGLLHDVVATGSMSDAAAVSHVISMQATDPDTRQDTGLLAYNHIINTAGTAFSILAEGTQSVLATGMSSVANGGLPTSMGGFNNTFFVENTVEASISPEKLLCVYILAGNSSPPDFPTYAGYVATRFIWARGQWDTLLSLEDCNVTNCGLNLYQNTGWNGGVAALADIAGTVLTVTDFRTGMFRVNDFIAGPGVTPNTRIVSNGTGIGGLGTYNLNLASTVTNIVITSSASGNMPAIKMSRLSQIDFCGEIPDLYYIKMSKTEDRIHIKAANANSTDAAIAFDSGMGNLQVEIPITSTDQALELGIGKLSFSASSQIGFPSIGYNIKSGGGSNTWRYRTADKANWIQFNNGQFWFWSDPSGAANAVTPNNLVFKVQENGIVVPDTIFVQGSTTNKSLKTIDASGLNIIGNDYSTTLAFFGQIGSPNLTFPAANSHIVINGNQVLQGRVTGYSAFTGTTDRATVYSTATITLQQLAERVAALQEDSTIQGFIGA